MTLQQSLQKLRKPRLFLLRRVMGESMLPTLAPGIVVLGIRHRRIRPGDIVVVRHDDLDKIKRVQDIQGNKVFLTGDNSLQSTDSHHFGWLDIRAVVAKVIWPRTQTVKL